MIGAAATTKRIAIIFVALVLPGCVGQNFSTDSANHLKTIAVVGPANPTDYGLAVGNLGTAVAIGLAGVGGGAAGGMLAGSLASSGRASTLTDALASQNLRLGDELNTAVEAALKQDDYDIIPQGDAQSTVDATLTLEIQQSKYERRVWGKIGPHVVIVATLADATSGRKLFARIYWYDMYSANLGLNKILRPDDKYGFDNAEDVLAHPDIAAAGFRAIIPMIAADLKVALKKS